MCDRRPDSKLGRIRDEKDLLAPRYARHARLFSINVAGSEGGGERRRVDQSIVDANSFRLFVLSEEGGSPPTGQNLQSKDYPHILQNKRRRSTQCAEKGFNP